MRFKLLSFFIALFSGQACVTPKMQTVWKPEKPLPYRFEKILVVAIMPGCDDSVRAAVEKESVRELMANGYQAVSYSDGFSVYEISATTTQEAAYFTLCDKGIDCILTLAKVDPARTVSVKKGPRKRFPAYFYFKHIWNYRELPEAFSSPANDRIWECILFDLHSLKQQSVLQVSRLPGLINENEAEWIAPRVIRKMLQDSALGNSTQEKQIPLKGF